MTTLFLDPVKQKKKLAKVVVIKAWFMLMIHTTTNALHSVQLFGL